MQGSFFKEMPKFKTPEEELGYLRAHVAEREQELMKIGHLENATENGTKDVIGVYKDIPAEKLVHESNIINEKEAKGIVLAQFLRGNVFVNSDYIFGRILCGIFKVAYLDELLFP